jgi:N6-L-threonylcarbamoyladenine synthase
MLGREGADFSFSGLKTAVRLIAKERAPLSEQDRADIAAGFQAAVVEVLSDRVYVAMQQFRTEFGVLNNELTLVAAGGVAANGPIRAGLQEVARQEGFSLLLPPVALCTDNGAMVAWAGLERLSSGFSDTLDVPPLARWPLQDLNNPRQREAGMPSPASLQCSSK